MKKLLIVAILTMMAANAQAGLTGNTYMTFSLDGQQAYIAGYTEGITFMGANCNFDGSQTYLQIFNIVEKYLRNNPENTHWEMSLIYGDAIMKAFDCKGSDAVIKATEAVK